MLSTNSIRALTRAVGTVDTLRNGTLEDVSKAIDTLEEALSMIAAEVVIIGFASLLAKDAK